MKLTDMSSICISALENMRSDCACVCEVAHDIYSKKSNDSASIGAHMRHVLEFFQLLASSIESRHIDYELRQRKEVYETDPDIALAAFDEAFNQLMGYLNSISVQTEMTLVSLAGYGLPPITYSTTISREIIYVIEHAIHHFAIIKMIAQGQGVLLPEDLGVAPSTLKYNASQVAA